MEKALILHQHGAAENLICEAVKIGKPGPTELRLRQTFLGVNFHDIYVRTGEYQTLPLPGIPGIEGVGIVEEVGSDIAEFEVGDRVAYVTGEYGSYASVRLLQANKAIKLPSEIDDRLAASVFLKGLTVEMLVRQVFKVEPGVWVLVQAAAGAVGQLLAQWAKGIGANVIGTVGSQDKVAVALSAGCSHVILYREEDVAARVMDITDRRGVSVVYDGVGKDSFEGSLASLSLCGHLVSFGQASGPIEPFPIARLAGRSLTISRPIIFHYLADRTKFKAMSSRLFEALKAEWLASNIITEFRLDEGSEAHRFLESRKAIGSVILAV